MYVKADGQKKIANLREYFLRVSFLRTETDFQEKNVLLSTDLHKKNHIFLDAALSFLCSPSTRSFFSERVKYFLLASLCK